MRKALWLVMAGMLALGACQKKAGTTASGQATPSTAPAPAAAGVAQSPAPPPTGVAAAPLRRAGLWEQTVSSAGKIQTSRICLDPSLAKELAAWGEAHTDAKCSEGPMAPRAGGGWSFSSTCDLGRSGKTTTTGVMSGDPASRYQIDAESTTSGAPAPSMNGVHKFSMKAAWVGPCPADMKPGDMTLPGGQRINLAALTKAHPGQRR